MGKYRTLSDVSEDYFRDHPEEIHSYLTSIFEDYAEDDDMGALLSQLRVVVRVQGISAMADEIGMTRAGLQKVLSEDGNPRLDTLSLLMRAMGYRLVPAPLTE